MAKTTVQKKPASAGMAQVDIPHTVGIENVGSVYCNNLEVLGGGLLDVRLAFNEILIERNPRRVAVIRRANVVMSYPHFKAMVEVLNNTLSQIEAAATNEQRAMTGMARVES